jgi:hypothetical protein
MQIACSESRSPRTAFGGEPARPLWRQPRRIADGVSRATRPEWKGAARDQTSSAKSGAGRRKASCSEQEHQSGLKAYGFARAGLWIGCRS